MPMKSKYSYKSVDAMTYKKFSELIKKSLKDNFEQKKKYNMDKGLKFKIHPELEMKKNLPYSEIPRQFWITPEPLVNLCTCALDRQPLPQVFNWRMDQVLRWIVEIGFPQYKETFRENKINGRTLLLLTNPSYLVAMNIKNMKHILTITESIRELFKIEKLTFNRNKTMPELKPDTNYKFYRIRNGPKYDNLRYSDFLRKIKLIRDPLKNLNHWQKLEEFLEHLPNHQTEIIAFTPRYNLYSVKKEPKIIEYQDTKIYCDCMPPCDCKWKKSDYRPPWKLSILVKNGKLKESSAKKDVVKIYPPEICGKKLTIMENKNHNEKDSTAKNKYEKCCCMPPCTCNWKITKKQHSKLSILEEKYSLERNPRISIQFNYVVDFID